MRFMPCAEITKLIFFLQVLVVPRVASIGEKSPTNERGLELTPRPNTNYAVVSNNDAAPTSPNHAIVSTTTLPEDLEANIQQTSTGDNNEVYVEDKTYEKGSF